MTPQPLYARERTAVPIEYEVGCVPELVLSSWGTEKCLTHAGIQTPNHPARSLASVPTTL